MKKTIKTFVGRLRNAWSIMRGRNCVYILFNDNVSKKEVLRSAGFLIGVQWLKSNEYVNVFSRTEMLMDLLSSDNSIMMLTKDADGRLTYCYDCKSEEDFNDLINMEVK